MFGESECLFKWLHVTEAPRVSRDSAAKHMKRTTLFTMFPAQLHMATYDHQHAMVVQFSRIFPMFQELVYP